MKKDFKKQLDDFIGAMDDQISIVDRDIEQFLTEHDDLLPYMHVPEEHYVSEVFKEFIGEKVDPIREEHQLLIDKDIALNAIREMLESLSMTLSD